MTSRDFAEAVTVLMNDQSAYRRLSTLNLIVIEGVMGVVIDGIRAELHRRKSPKLRIVKK